MIDNFESRFWYLRDHDFFWEINSKDLKSLCVIMGFKKAKKGDIIFFADEDDPRVYFLKRGALKIVSSNEKGEEMIQEIIRRGNLFGQLLSEKKAGSAEEYAISLTDDVVICSFLAKDFEDLMVKKPHLALKYTKIMAFRFKRIANSYNNLFFKSAKSRLISFLIDWSVTEGKEQNGKILLENYLTQSDLAQIICATRQTGTTLINSLENDGYLTYGRKEIIVHDLEKLKNLALNVK